MILYHQNNLLVKRAFENDAVLVSEIASSTFYETFIKYNTEEDLHLYIQKAYSVSLLLEQLKLIDDFLFLLVFIDEQCIGFAKVCLKSRHPLLKGNVMELEKIYFKQGFHGKGYAEILLNICLDIITKENCENLFLGVWQENHRAVKFYQKHGFTIIDTRTFQLGSRVCHDYIMNKIL